MIKVYSTPTCPWCQRMKAYLQERKVEYQDFDVSKDVNARNEMIQKSGQMGVPQADINGRWIVGFDKPAIEEALKAKPE